MDKRSRKIFEKNVNKIVEEVIDFGNRYDPNEFVCALAIVVFKHLSVLPPERIGIETIERLRIALERIKRGEVMELKE